MSQPVVRLHFRTYPEDHLWVGECIELDIASGGQTEEEAQRRAEEAAHLYLMTVAEHGDLERILSEKWIPISYEDDPPIGHFEERTVLLPMGSQ